MKHHRKNGKSKKRGGFPLGKTDNYYSGANWMLNTVGNGNTQYDNVFSNSTPYTGYGNALPSSNYKHHVGGKTRRRKRGGNFANVINQAIVPFGLLGLNQSFRRKKGKGGKSRRRR